MDAMLARDLLDLPATKVLTQSKVRRIFYENVLNLVSRLQFLSRFISFYCSSSTFKIAIFIIFSVISHFIYFIFKWRVLRLKHKWTWSKAKFELQIKICGWVTMVVTSAKLSISSHLHFPWAKPLVICKSHEHVLKSWASHLQTPLQQPKIISKLLCNKLKSFATATLCDSG